MRATLSLLALLAFLCGSKSYAQGEPPLAPGAQLVSPQQPAQQYHAEDGGVRGEVLESIVGPPRPMLPFRYCCKPNGSEPWPMAAPSL